MPDFGGLIEHGGPAARDLFDELRLAPVREMAKAVRQLEKSTKPAAQRTGIDERLVRAVRDRLPLEDLMAITSVTDPAEMVRRLLELDPRETVLYLSERLLAGEGDDDVDMSNFVDRRPSTARPF